MINMLPGRNWYDDYILYDRKGIRMKRSRCSPDGLILRVGGRES